MLEKFKILVKSVGIIEAIKVLGGFNVFKEIADNNPQFKEYLGMLKASCSVSFDGYPDAYFDFYITDYEGQYDDFGELEVDMIVDFSNLSGEEIYNLKQWIGAVADDHGFEIYDLGDKFAAHVSLYIKSFNGKPYSWPGFDGLEISDEEAFELLDKTGKWKGMIRESINESVDDDLKVVKQRFFKVWDGRGYASVDDMIMKLFHVSQEHNYTVQDWVQEWNERHNIIPLKYLEEDGYKFEQSTTSPHNYYLIGPPKTLTLSDSNLSGDVIITRIDVDTKHKYVAVYIEVDFGTITEGGRKFDDMYPYNDEVDDDDYYLVMDEYFEEFHWLTAKHFQEKYTDKMGYTLEIERY